MISDVRMAVSTENKSLSQILLSSLRVNKTFALMIFLMPFIVSCNSYSDKKSTHVWVDFADTTAEQIAKADTDTNVIRVAIASIVSPQETFIQYNNILDYIEEKLNKRVALVQRKTYKEVNSLLKNNQIDLAFICSGAYVAGTMDSSFDLLVVPERNGKHFYQSYLIVNKKSSIKCFCELLNKRFVFSDSLSNTGMFYPLKRLRDLNSNAGNFFSETYLSNAHNYSIELVSRRIVDGAAVNSLIYDYQAKFNPETIENTKIIEKSEWFGMPPIVVSKGVDNELKKDLLALFTQMHNDTKGQEILNHLYIDKYVTVPDSIYNGVRQMYRYIFSER